MSRLIHGYDLSRPCRAEGCHGGLINGTCPVWSPAKNEFLPGHPAIECVACDGTGYEKREEGMRKSSKATEVAGITDTERLDWLLDRDVEGGQYPDEGEQYPSGTYWMKWLVNAIHNVARGASPRECIDNAIRGDVEVTGL